ncbi:MAG: hypothetical protein HOY71_41740, partial [Nonomuraea sp.]|nr:hypothetical protein [Nonomuraea sp.]
AHLGWSLAAKADLIAIGAPYEDQAQLADAGSVYVRRGSGSLRRIQEDSDGVLGNAEVGDQFGWSLAFAAGNALVVGVPYENDDGPGRQVASGKIDSGSVTVLKDVLAPTLTSLKIDSPSKTAGDKYGYAIAYSDSAGLAVSAPGPGYVQVFGKDFKPTRTVRGTAGFGLALAASTDGRFAAASPDSVETTAGQSFPVAASALAFGGNRLYVGMPDGGRRGSVSYAGRNDSSLNALEPAKGEDFGAALGGG